MTNIAYSRHAQTRMQQRGVRKKDIELFLACATQVDENVYFLRLKDATREIDCRKQEIQTLERLRNRKVVVAGDMIVTCYSSGRRDQKRTLRHGRQKV